MSDNAKDIENTDNMPTEETSSSNIKVYLDNCAYNRPYDDQSQAKIELETQAKLKIQRMIKSHRLDLASSYMSLYECGENPDVDKADAIIDFIETYTKAHAGEDRIDIIEERAKPIIEAGVKFKDACHVAAAIYTGADYFISTDQRLLKYQTDEIKLVNPMQFFYEAESELSDEDEENDF